MGLNLFAQPELYNTGIMSRPEEAIECAKLVGFIGGGAVQIYVEPLMTEQNGVEKNFHIRLANGRTFNVRQMLTGLKNAKVQGSKLEDVIGQYNIPAPGDPAGVSFECSEVDVNGLRNWLANAGHPELVVQGSGVISTGATDVDAAKDGLTAKDVSLPPIGNVPANYVVFLANPHGRATIVNAAFLVDLTRRGGGVEAALAFVRTRQRIKPEATNAAVD
jgi:hypothetical protein